MADDIFADASRTVFGKTPLAFLQEVVIQNRGLSFEITEALACKILPSAQGFVGIVTLTHPRQGKVVVTGPAAATKQAAKHAAAVEVFRRLRLTKSWLLHAQAPMPGGKKWQIPEESFLSTDKNVMTAETVVSPVPVNKASSQIPSACSAGNIASSSGNQSPNPRVTPLANPVSPSSSDSNAWILRLITYCATSKMYSEPTFEVLSIAGSSNMPVFTVSCVVKNSRTGHSIQSRIKMQGKKQAARQSAAQNVLIKLKAMDGVQCDVTPLSAGGSILEVDDVVIPPEISSRYTGVARLIEFSSSESENESSEKSKLEKDVSSSSPEDSRMDMEQNSSSGSEYASCEDISEDDTENEREYCDDEEEGDGFFKVDLSRLTENLSRSVNLPPLIFRPGGGLTPLTVDYEDFSITFDFENVICPKPFEECVKMGESHLSHAAIRDLKMNSHILETLVSYDSVMAQDAVGVLDELVQQQPLLPKKRTEYLEMLRPVTAERERKTEDHTVYVEYQQFDPWERTSLSKDDYDYDFYASNRNFLDSISDDDEYWSDDDDYDDDYRRVGVPTPERTKIPPNHICVAARFHHQSIDFVKFGFGLNLKTAKDEAALDLVRFIGQQCQLYREKI